MEIILENMNWNKILIKLIENMLSLIEGKEYDGLQVVLELEELLPNEEITKIKKEKNYGTIIRFLDSFCDAKAHGFDFVVTNYTTNKAESDLSTLLSELKKGKSKQLIYLKNQKELIV